MTTASAPRTARERARAELTGEIKREARRQLAVDGAAGLSLRAVARELGMVSSAVYRYFPSRDDLLTALIVDAYDSIGRAAEDAAAGSRRDDLPGRWLAVCRAVRAWALANPHEYGLIYGSPVPGYVAPQDTIDPATRVSAVLLAIVVDAEAAGRTAVVPAAPMPRRVRADLASLRRRYVPSVPEPVLERALMAWTLLFGTVSFELFGHLHSVVEDYEAFFEHAMASGATLLGILS